MAAKEKKLYTLTNYEEVNDFIAQIAAIRLTADSKENEMNKLILATKTNFEPEIKILRDKADLLEKQIQEFCNLKKKDFNLNRSRELTFGKIGFRTGKASLKIKNAKTFTWDRVLEKVQNIFGMKYLKVQTELNKSQLLLDYEKGLLDDEKITAIGCKVVKAEKFFLDIDYDKIKLEGTR